MADGDRIREGQNPKCVFILRGDFNDCAHAGGGRGAKDRWCRTCVDALLARLHDTERDRDAAEAYGERWSRYHQAMTLRAQAAEKARDEERCERILAQDAAEAAEGRVRQLEAALGYFMDELDEAVARGECGECPPTVETEHALREALAAVSQEGETA